MKRASYREGIHWIAANDDTEWVDHEQEDACGTPSVTACLLADLFGKDVEEVRVDIRREIARQDKERT